MGEIIAQNMFSRLKLLMTLSLTSWQLLRCIIPQAVNTV